MYKLIKSSITGETSCVQKQEENILYSIPFDPANIDYANFKTAILEDKAQLQDADGNTMTAEQAKDFVKELP
jgi:hypothetical protein